MARLERAKFCVIDGILAAALAILSVFAPEGTILVIAGASLDMGDVIGIMSAGYALAGVGACV